MYDDFQRQFESALQTDQAELDRLRLQWEIAHVRLLKAVASACPGAHHPVQHRDRKPPWCRECGRTADGTLVANPTPTEQGKERYGITHSGGSFRSIDDAAVTAERLRKALGVRDTTDRREDSPGAR